VYARRLTTCSFASILSVPVNGKTPHSLASATASLLLGQQLQHCRTEGVGKPLAILCHCLMLEMRGFHRTPLQQIMGI
jgi:hypothetical protein